MSDTEIPAVVPSPVAENELTPAEKALIEKLGGSGGTKYVRFILAALGSIPWVGGVLGAAAALSAEQEQGKVNQLQKLWLQEHRGKIGELGQTLQEILTRLDGFGEEVRARIESPAYLALVRRTFRSWDEADTQEKKQMLKKLITNAGAIMLCPDDLVRLFIGWIEQYHEAHFMVVRHVYQNPGATRGEIWDAIHSTRPREDSAEADLFRYLISDLTLGRVMRQERETNAQGQFVRRSTQGTRRAPSTGVMESAFEDTKPYELTQLGGQFVHYVMEDVVPQLEQAR